MAKKVKEELLKVDFSLKDVGSEIIDQLSSDIYTRPGAILREIVKNAYDAYLHIQLPDGDEPTITITRERSGKKGVLRIADEAIGQDLDTLKGNVQISISRKKQESESATGFRGLGSWAALGAGSKIIIQTQLLDSAHVLLLTINIRRIYQKLAPDVTLDSILNDQQCIKFTKRAGTEGRHGTVVEIHCDGPPKRVNGYELNRLWKFTDPDDPVTTDELHELLLGACPIPYSQESLHSEDIYEIYELIGYEPTVLQLDGERLERRLPSQLTGFSTSDIEINGQSVAKCWYAFNPTKTADVAKNINKKEHCLPGAGILVLRANVPIGKPNAFASSALRTTNWYVGEVHITANDIRPDAGGDNLRQGTSRIAFLDSLERFYGKREDEGERRSQRLSAERKLKKAIASVQRMKEGKVNTAAERARVDSAALNAVELLDKLSTTGPPKPREKHLRDAARTRDFRKLRKEAEDALESQGLLDKFSARKSTKKSTQKTTKKETTQQSSKKKKTSRSTSNEPAKITISPAEIQASFGRQVPKLKKAGLTDEQVEVVLDLVAQAFEAISSE